MISSLPVLIITFERPNRLKSMLENCFRAGIKRFYIAIDGGLPGSQAVDTLFNEAINEFKSNRIVDIKIWSRQENLGLAISVITAIDWFFTHEHSGIIFEDDIEITKNSIDFLEKSLELLNSNKDILLISGSQFFANIFPQNGVSVCNYPLIWGWATWRDRWLGFRESMTKPLQPEKAKNLPKKVKYFLLASYTRAISTEINSWAIIFAAYSRFNNFLCICPNVNLVSNTGFDSSAIHTKSKSWPLNLEISSLIIDNFTLDVSSSLNKLIEKHIYRIKRHHVLFVLKYHSKSKIFVSKSKLNESLDQITLPKYE